MTDYLDGMRESRVTCTIKPCMGCTDHLSELEARYHKAQAEAWQRRARQLKGDNLMLHDKVEMLQRRLARYRAKVGGLKAENAKLRDDLQRANAENAKLREQMERLVTLLRVDCDIDASWDGLRRFWSIGLTEDGCLMRDRACKAEAENEHLRDKLARYRELEPVLNGGK